MTPARRRPLRGHHRQATSSAASPSSSTARWRARPSSRARSPAATRQITMGAGNPDQQLADAAQARAGAQVRRAPGADLALQRAAHRRVARARTPSCRAARARSPASSSCWCSWSPTTAAPASSPNIAVLFNLVLQIADAGDVRRLDDPARHRRPRAHRGHRRRRQRPHQRAHPRGAAPRQEPARRGRRRLRQGVQRHHRRPRDHAHLRPHPRCSTARAPSRASPSRSSSACWPASSPASCARA